MRHAVESGGQSPKAVMRGLEKAPCFQQHGYNRAKKLVCWRCVLLAASVLDQPHKPACRDRSPDEQGEAERSKPDHRPRFRAHRDSKDDRREEGEEQDCSKMGDGHDAFLPVASE